MFFTNLFRLYQKCIKTRPILTNCISTGTLFAVGDGLAQYLFPNQAIPTEEDVRKSSSKVPRPLAHPSSRYDYKRTLRAAIYGGIIFAPIGHKWYQFMARLQIPIKSVKNMSVRSQKIINTIYRVGFDQLLFAPIAVPMYYSVMCVMENRSFDDLKQRLRDNYKVTLLTNWIIWPAFQSLNFSLIPLEYRLLSVNIVSIFWNCFLSYRNSHVVESKQLPVYNPPVPE